MALGADLLVGEVTPDGEFEVEVFTGSGGRTDGPEWVEEGGDESVKVDGLRSGNWAVAVGWDEVQSLVAIDLDGPPPVMNGPVMCGAYEDEVLEVCGAVVALVPLDVVYVEASAGVAAGHATASVAFSYGAALGGGWGTALAAVVERVAGKVVFERDRGAVTSEAISGCYGQRTAVQVCAVGVAIDDDERCCVLRPAVSAGRGCVSAGQGGWR